MNLEQIKSMFPLEAQVTQEIIDKSNPWNPYYCIGHHTLKKYLGNDAVISWLDTVGVIKTEQGNLHIKTKDRVSVMDIEEPRTVTFELI